MLLAIVMVVSFAACGDETSSGGTGSVSSTTSGGQNSNTGGDKTDSTSSAVSGGEETLESFEEAVLQGVDLSNCTIEDLERIAAKDAEYTVNKLNHKWKKLAKKIVTADDYKKNENELLDLYSDIQVTIGKACARLEDYTARYADLIMATDKSNSEKCAAFGQLKSCIYEGALAKLHEGIYKGLLEEIRDQLIKGILTGQDQENAMYLWYDGRSMFNEAWYSSDESVFNFLYRMNDRLTDGLTDQAKDVLATYKEDVEKLKKQVA